MTMITQLEGYAKPFNTGKSRSSRVVTSYFDLINQSGDQKKKARGVLGARILLASWSLGKRQRHKEGKILTRASCAVKNLNHPPISLPPK